MLSGAEEEEAERVEEDGESDELSESESSELDSWTAIRILEKRFSNLRALKMCR